MKVLILTFIFLAQIVSFALSCGKGPRERIVGGQVATKGHWGWQVGVSYYDRIICGGAIMNEEWVITAANCVNDKNPMFFFASVHVGLHDKDNLDSWTQKISVEKIFIHENNTRYENRNDIALLKLRKPIQYNEYIESVCLPYGTETFENIFAWVTGFGFTKNTGADTSRVLMEVQVPIMTDGYCKHIWKIDTDTQICTGYNGLGKDTCYGDYGGPLVKKASDGIWYLVGLASYGSKFCGNGAVYTRISAFTHWIDNKILSNMFD